MMPFLPQEPPRGVTTSQMLKGGPPVASIFFNLPPAKNAIERLSGDQNGDKAPCVPGIIDAERARRGRTQRFLLPRLSSATKASFRPPGDRGMWPPPKL